MPCADSPLLMRAPLSGTPHLAAPLFDPCQKRRVLVCKPYRGYPPRLARSKPSAPAHLEPPKPPRTETAPECVRPSRADTEALGILARVFGYKHAVERHTKRVAARPGVEMATHLREGRRA